MQEPFKIGLIMAGAVSAGAYTAGAISFLFEALDKWYQAQKEGHNVPSHKVNIQTLAGSSAGGMCTAMTAAAIVRGDMGLLKEAWVDQIDIKHLLDNSDLINESNINSLLNSEKLDKIAELIIKIDTKDDDKWFDFLSDELNIFLAATNLDGIKSNIMFNDVNNLYTLINHRVQAKFTLLNPKSPFNQYNNNGNRYLHYKSPNQNWQYFKEWALASGAFPIALKSRFVNILKPELIDNYLSLGEYVNVPNFRDYLCVDAGVTDNEPIKPALESLGLKAGEKVDANQSKAAIIMLDPFPNEPNIDNDNHKHQDIFSIIGYLITTLRNQAKFKPEELLLAMDNNDFSRFIIAPKRASANRRIGNFMASGALEGFSGFFEKEFREHDYQLGRKNCQKFLLEHFRLPKEHQLFNDWEKDLINKYIIENKYLPIIPLIDNLNPNIHNEHKIETPDWQKIKMTNVEVEKIKDKFKKRMELLVDKGVNKIKLRWLYKIILKWFVKGKINKFIDKNIIQELENYDLIKK
ncbi:MAG: patatin-like phospholipase family protein [Microscillaceae bacterium]|jgi:hypothetical protein|nr:patatin-like phospholipase family protein [Microscillaceae bacterium]